MTTVTAHAVTLEADPTHSSIGFSVRHLMISTVNGQFTDFTGTVDTPNVDKFEKAKVRFTVKTASINTANSKRDEHLRSDDFFAVDKHPEATFVSEKVEPAGKDRYKIKGKLTLHGVTRDVVFNARSFGKVKDPWGNVKYGFQATTELDRKDYGLTWNKALETGGVAVGDKVKLTVDLEMAEKKELASK